MDSKFATVDCPRRLHYLFYLKQKLGLELFKYFEHRALNSSNIITLYNDNNLRNVLINIMFLAAILFV